MTIRNYDPAKDKETAHRIWYETGWIGDKDDEAAMDTFIGDGRTLVAEMNGEAEALVAAMPGSIRYQAEELHFSAVTAVTTSRIARKQGFARRLTAALIAAEAAEGAQVSGLGMFEQGFYNRLGYGTGGYEHWISFDPAQLNVPQAARPPRRLSKDDWELMHNALLARQRGHGAINIYPTCFTQAEIGWGSKHFGLGFNDDENGELTHFFWSSAKGEHGPYGISAMAYQTSEQFLELLGLLKNLGDQVRMVRMREPKGIQFQDLLVQPFRHRQLTAKSEFENTCRATAYWQVRICDLAGCLAKTHLPSETVRFNLQLSDPITQCLDSDAPWQGNTGEYLITLGPESAADAGSDPTLPTLTASINAFTRLWLGVQPATGLATTDDLSGPPDLLHTLDRTFRLPDPSPGWDF